MIVYVTSQPCNRLKNAISNLKQYKIIDIDTIMKECGLDANNEIHGFIIDSEIERMINEGISSKKYIGIVYTNSNISPAIIDKLKEILYKKERKELFDIVLLDDYDVPKLKALYKRVDSVTFFPIIKKTHIIRCNKVKIK